MSPRSNASSWATASSDRRSGSLGQAMVRLTLRHGAGVGFAVLFFAGWEAVVRGFAVPLYILPPPSSVLYQLFRNLPRIAQYTLVTGGESLGGFSLAILMGVPLALL